MVPKEPLPTSSKSFPSARTLAELPVVLGTTESAAIAGVTERTIRRWIYEKRLRANRSSPSGSSRVRILRDDLLRLLFGEV